MEWQTLRRAALCAAALTLRITTVAVEPAILRQVSDKAAKPASAALTLLALTAVAALVAAAAALVAAAGLLAAAASAPAPWRHRHDTACARKGPLQQGLSQDGYGIGISWARYPGSIPAPLEDKVYDTKGIELGSRAGDVKNTSTQHSRHPIQSPQCCIPCLMWFRVVKGGPLTYNKASKTKPEILMGGRVGKVGVHDRCVMCV
jgi:hypothetical protein